VTIPKPARTAHPLVRLDFIVRLLGCPMGALIVVSARVDEPTPHWMWIGLAIYALLWPHIARAIGIRSADSRQMEIRLLVVDAMLGGVWIPITSFRPAPAMALLICYTTILASVGGLRLLAKGLPLVIVAILFTGLLTGFRIEPTGTYFNTLLSVTMLFMFELIMAVQTYRQARGFVQSRRRVAEQAEEIQNQNEALVHAREEALQAAQAKAAFLATMSHEIRTPMNGVLGMTRLLSETPLSNDQRDFVRTIQLSGNSLLAIINDILDYSKIESGRMEVEDEPLRIAEALEESFEIVAERARQKGIELLYQIAPEVPDTIRGDITRLRQVITNLAGNAVKFTEHGEVFVDVRLVRAEEGDEPAEIAFDVRDSGIGIPEDRIPMLFSAFSQVDASTTRKYGGTGLGLAISRRLTELMGGTVTVKSTPGVGSTFTFTIKAHAAAAVEAPFHSLDAVPLYGRRVLIVDDNATNRKVLSQQLAAWNFIAESTDGARAALSLLAEKHFDVAVLDLHMPDVDGLMLAREIRKMADLRELPLVLLSSSVVQGKDDPEHLFVARLTKPVRQSKLFDALMSAGAALRDERVERQTSPGVRRVADIAPLRILVADDNDVNRKLAGLILRRFGYAADFSTNGREALEQVLHAAIAPAEEPYDVVLMDVHMPEMDGLEATRLLREHQRDQPNRQWPRIVAVTADAMQGDRDLCIDAGMDDYLTKPLDFDAVQRMLERMANEKAGASMPTIPGMVIPTPRVAESAALIDWSRLEELREYDTPDGEVVKSAVASFVTQIPDKLTILRSSVAESDGQTLRHCAHGLKGAATNIGATAVATYASQLELAGKSEAFEGTTEVLETLSVALDETVQALNARYLS
jgi:signal transduction histidine kinase/DNA-binding response OmpR family regulator